MPEKLLEPSYGKNLVCLAGDCPENCCMEWDIDIDDETAAYYRTVSGEFGDELRKWMRVDGKPLDSASAADGERFGAEPCGEAPQAAQAASAPDGRDVLDDSGLFTGTSCTTFALNGTNCPFLQEDGLCRLRLTLGYEHTSETCREHPFNTEEYDGFAERSPSVSCPEAVRLVFETPVNASASEGGTDQQILSTTGSEQDAEDRPAAKNPAGISGQTYPDAPTDSSDAVLNMLAKTRNTILSAKAFDEAAPLDVHILDLLDRTYLLQPSINDAAPEYAFKFDEDIFVQLLTGFEDFRTIDEMPLLVSLQDLCLFMRENLSILTDRWKKQLEGVQTKVFDCGYCDDTFGAFLDAHAVELSRLFAYYIYRYFLKAVNDCETPVWSAFIACGALVPAFLSYANGESLKKTSAWYSREIEHDSDNAEKILAYFRENLSENWEDFT